MSLHSPGSVRRLILLEPLNKNAMGGGGLEFANPSERGVGQ